MVRTVLTPSKDTISLSIPSDYIGKKVEILLYTFEEINAMPSNQQRGNFARFKGILTNDEADRYNQYLQKARQEWERDI